MNVMQEKKPQVPLREVLPLKNKYITNQLFLWGMMPNQQQVIWQVHSK